jgi:phage tail sheath protein FI
MSFRPGTRVLVQDTPPPRSSPADTGVMLIAGLTEKGPLAPASESPIQSLSDFIRVYGSRVSYGMVYDAAEAYFGEGGGSMYVSRVVGTTPVAAFRAFNDAGAVSSLIISANSPGAWGNSLRVAILAGDAGGNFKIQVTHATDTSVSETSPDLADQAAALDWLQYSSYITATLGAGANDPAVIAAQALTGGTDDQGTVADPSWQAALDRLPSALGPGQVIAPGRTTDAAHAQLLQHAADKNRVALLDAPDTNTKATLIQSAVNSRLNGRYGSLWAPWYKMAGITPGTTRTVPPSVIMAGIIARNDGLGLSPNSPSAGDERGLSRIASGLSHPTVSEVGWTASDRNDLTLAGVNVIRNIRGGIEAYGYRSLADPVGDRSWVNFGNVRLRMAIVAQANAILENYLFDEIDGRNFLMNDLKGALTGMLVDFYNLGSLYGETPDKAFYVDVGNQINTPTTIANRELHAVITLRMSEFAEYVELVLVKRAITQGVV